MLFKFITIVCRFHFIPVLTEIPAYLSIETFQVRTFSLEEEYTICKLRCQYWKVLLKAAEIFAQLKRSAKKLLRRNKRYEPRKNTFSVNFKKSVTSGF